MDFFAKKKDDVDDDPSDFQQAPLQAFDASLRCPICKEFFRHPVITPCNHSFCSSCIRVSLELDHTEKRTCPICATKITSEKDLRANGALEDIIDRYKNTRPLLLDLARPPPPPTPSRKRRKPNEPSKAATPSGSRPMSTGSSKARPAADDAESSGPARDEIIELSDDDDDDDDDGHDSHGRAPGSSAGAAEQPQKGEATCPICNKVVPMITMNPHIDSECRDYLKLPQAKKPNESRGGFFGTSGASSSKKSGSGVPGSSSNGNAKPTSTSELVKDGPVVQRLSRPNYNLLSEKQLKTKLEDFSLSTLGKKADLESRHRQWILIYNSNLDSRHPAKESELRTELRKWDADRERDLKAKKKRAEKEPLDDETYQKVHAADFATLTKQVRERMMAQKKKKSEEGVENATDEEGTDT